MTSLTGSRYRIVASDPQALVKQQRTFETTVGSTCQFTRDTGQEPIGRINSVAVKMKIVAIVSFICLAACVYGEKCTTNTDCTSGSTSCSSGYHIICEHPAGGVTTGGGLCTCAKDNYTCTTRADCVGDAVALRCIDDRHRHCYDGKCICTRW